MNVASEQRKYKEKGMKPDKMQKDKEPLRSCIVTEPQELLASQEEMRVNSDDSHQSVTHLVAMFIQAYDLWSFLNQ